MKLAATFKLFMWLVPCNSLSYAAFTAALCSEHRVTLALQMSLLRFDNTHSFWSVAPIDIVIITLILLRTFYMPVVSVPLAYHHLGSGFLQHLSQSAADLQNLQQLRTYKLLKREF